MAVQEAQELQPGIISSSERTTKEKTTKKGILKTLLSPLQRIMSGPASISMLRGMRRSGRRRRYTPPTLERDL